jgi:hypothetical protein
MIIFALYFVGSFLGSGLCALQPVVTDTHEDKSSITPVKTPQLLPLTIDMDVISQSLMIGTTSKSEDENISRCSEILCGLKNACESPSSSVSSERLHSNQSQTGIWNDNSCCYMNSVVSSLASIRLVVKSFYTEFEQPSKTPASRLVWAFADAFTRLNSPSYEIPVTSMNLLQPVITADMGWEFGPFHCVLEFWDRLLDSLPSTLRSKVFAFETCYRYMMKRNAGKSVEIKRKTANENILLIAISSESSSLEEYIDGNMIDKEADSYTIEAADADNYTEVLQEMQRLTGEKPIFPCKIPMDIFADVVNTPEVLAVGLKRLRIDVASQTYYLLDTPFKLNKSITVADTLYHLRAFVVYNCGHYFSFVRSRYETSWKVYNDDIVTVIEEDEVLEEWRDGSATLAFYVRGGSEICMETAKINVPEELVDALVPETESLQYSDSDDSEGKDDTSESSLHNNIDPNIFNYVPFNTNDYVGEDRGDKEYDGYQDFLSALNPALLPHVFASDQTVSDTTADLSASSTIGPDGAPLAKYRKFF